MYNGAGQLGIHGGNPARAGALRHASSASSLGSYRNNSNNHSYHHSHHGADASSSSVGVSNNNNNSRSSNRDENETNIQVVVRCRGRNEREIRENSPVVVVIPQGNSSESAYNMNSSSYSYNSRENTSTLFLRTHPMDKTMGKTYSFDRVFGQDATQIEIHEEIVVPILEQVLSGYNCTIFCYGQTATGKTYTIQGDLGDGVDTNSVRTSIGGSVSGKINLGPHAGIIPRSLDYLFSRLQKDFGEYFMKISCLELYNEELCDLLGEDAEIENLNLAINSSSNNNSNHNIATRKLKIFEDGAKKGRVQVAGLEEVLVSSVSDAISLLQKAATRRKIAATKCNDKSSRSHAIYTITAHTREATPEGEELLKIGKLNLVDLAGSENVGRSGAENKRAREAGVINQSLLALGRVIDALVEKTQHIPYRESKLTRLLQDSLGGSTRTCIIATISPAKVNIDETNSTLDYANRARTIRNKPEINQRMSKKVIIRELETEMERLRSDLQLARDKNGVYLHPDEYTRLLDQLQSNEDLINDQNRQLNLNDEQLKLSESQKLELKYKLENKENELISTQNELNSTMRDLQQTRSTLSTTVRQLTEERHIRAAHASTEEELNTVATTLKSSLTEATSDLSLMHDKLNRVHAAKELASHQLSEMRNSITNHSQAFSQQLSAMLDMQRQTASTLLTNAKAFISDSSERLVKRSEASDLFVGKLRTRGDTLDNEARSAFEHLTSELSAIRGYHGELANYAMNFIDNVLDESAQKIVGLQNDVKQNSSSISTELLSLERTINSVTRTVSAACTDAHSAITELANDIKRTAATHNQRATQLVSQMDEDLENETKSIKKEGDAIIDEVRRMVDVFINRHSNAMNQYKSSITTSVQSLANETDSFSSRGATLMTRIGSTIESMNTSVTNDISSINKSIESSSAINKSAQQSYLKTADDIHAVIDELADNHHNRMQQLTTKTVSAIDSAVTSIEPIRSTMAKGAQELVFAVSENVEASKAADTAQHNEMAKAWVHSIETGVAEDMVGKQTASAVQATLSDINSLATNCSASINDQVVPTLHGTATGATPIRRSIATIGSWKRTRPHDELRRELHSDDSSALRSALKRPNGAMLSDVEDSAGLSHVGGMSMASTLINDDDEDPDITFQPKNRSTKRRSGDKERSVSFDESAFADHSDSDGTVAATTDGELTQDESSRSHYLPSSSTASTPYSRSRYQQRSKLPGSAMRSASRPKSRTAHNLVDPASSADESTGYNFDGPRPASRMQFGRMATISSEAAAASTETPGSPAVSLMSKMRRVAAAANPRATRIGASAFGAGYVSDSGRSDPEESSAVTTTAARRVVKQNVKRHKA
ncbi:kinesin-domain-containing protein [Ramicandelaber brevisporus]|nr:kinesin-domain-containing protein [Ramicandelaber brevisporus]